MKKKIALKYAMESMRKQRQLHAIGANLYAMGIKSESTFKDYIVYRDLTQAMNIITEIMKEIDA